MVCDMVVSDKEIVRRLKETIEFLKVESIGGVSNTPQLINLLEDLFKISRSTRIKGDKYLILVRNLVQDTCPCDKIISSFLSVSSNQ